MECLGLFHAADACSACPDGYSVPIGCDTGTAHKNGTSSARQDRRAGSAGRSRGRRRRPAHRRSRRCTTRRSVRRPQAPDRRGLPYRRSIATVLIPIPDHYFDVTEVAVPWRLLTRAGHRVRFATERGTAPAADQRLLDGVIMGKLGAAAEPRQFYSELQFDEEFRAPIAWADVQPDEFEGLILPGGHAPGMRQYLGSALLRHKVAEYWTQGRPVGAICHGVLVLARACDPNGRSLLYGRRTTCLPKYLERSAFVTTAWRLGRYYRTYPAYVEDEVRRALRDSADFVRGPRVLSKRGTDIDDGPAFFVQDGNYISARWPGDAYLFAKRFADQLGS